MLLAHGGNLRIEREVARGAAIADGTLYWGSGYSNFGFGTPNSKLYAFSLPD